MNFYCINIETIRKSKKYVNKNFKVEKKYTTPANEFLLHRRNTKAIRKLKKVLQRVPKGQTNKI